MSLIRVLYSWACQRLYHELAWSYDAISWLVSAGQWDAWRRLALVYVRGPRVLEIGFGTGVLLAELSAQGYEVIGLEPSAQMHAQAGLRLQSNGVNVDRCQGVAQRMPFADSSFDSVVSTFPAPYVLDEVTIAEIVRVLKPGGVWVTVGLWVVVDGNWLSKMLPVFYGRPNPEVINLLHARLASAGLRTKIEDRRVGRALVGVVIAEK